MAPPKLVKPPPPKSKGISKQPTKGKLLKGKGKIETPPPEEEIQPPPEPEKPPKPLWTTTIIPIPVLDAELHKELSAKRREKEKEKHFEFCEETLYDILALAFETVNDPDPKSVRRARINFHSEGDFKVDRPQTTMSIVSSKGGDIPKTRSSYFNPPPPQKMYGIPYLQALQNLLKITTEDKMKYDENSEIEELLEKSFEQKTKYQQNLENIEKVNFPFVICIAGSQCSGKTTITQYLQSFLKVQIVKFVQSSDNKLIANEKVHLITETDDKVNLQTLTTIHQNLEEGEGLVLINFPTNKSQIGQLEKIVLARGTKTVGGISAFIKIDITPEQTQELSNQRIFDKKSGQILGKSFYPPDFISSSYANEVELEDYPANIDPNSKSSSNLHNLEKSFKKVTQLLILGYLPFVTDLFKAVNELIAKIIENRQNIEVKPPVYKYENKKEFKYAKFCNDFFDNWNKVLLPKFGRELGSRYSDLSSMNKHITNVMSLTRDKFNLKINVKDEREEITDKFLKNEINQSKYFNEIWDLADSNRDKQNLLAEQIINAVGINATKALTNDDVENVFMSLMWRFQVIMHVINKYRSYLLEPSEEPPEIVDPQIEDVEECDLKRAAEIMYIDINGDGSIKIPEFLEQTNKKRPQAIICSPTRGPKIMTPGVNHSNKSKLAQHRPMTYSTVVKPLNYTKEQSSSGEWDVPTELNTILSKSTSNFRESAEESAEEETLFNNVAEFLHICTTKCNSESQKIEVQVLSTIFSQFVTEKNNIDHLVSQGKAILTKEFKDIVCKKHKQEMERFSEKFLRYQDNPRCPKPIFEYDHSTLSEHLKVLSDRAGGIPNPDYPMHLTKSKMENLVNESDKSKIYINLKELIETAQKAGFDDADCAELELIVRMTSNPEFIQVGPLKQIIGMQTPQPKLSQRPKTSLY